MRRIFRLGRAAVLLAAVVLGGGSVHLLHAFQVRRNAGALLEQAGQAKAAGDFVRAADYYGRYLGFRPDDAAALAEYGLALDRLAATPRQRLRAFLALDQAVRRDPGRDDVRRRAADLALTLGRTAEAREGYRYLLDHSRPGDAELEDRLGQCQEADKQFQDAGQSYEHAKTHDPRRVESYVHLASVLHRRLDRPKDADDAIDEMVRANPDSSQAHLARARYLRETDRLDAARPDLEAARAEAPDDPDVLLAAADLAAALGDPKAALQALEEGARAHPDDVRFRLGLASLELRPGGDRDQAVGQLREAAQALPGRPELAWVVADLLIDADETGEARRLLERLEADGPTPVTDYLRARLAFADGKAAEAAALLVRRRPDLAAAPELAGRADLLLGLCYGRLGNPDQQLAAFRRAAEQDPASLPARLGRADALLAVGKADAALAEYLPLVGRAPEARWAAVRLTAYRVLRLPPERRDWAGVEKLLADASDGQRKAAEYPLVRGEVLAAQGRADDAREGLREALQGDGRDPSAKARYWLALAALADRGRPADDAGPPPSLAVLADAERALGDRVEWRLARADRAAARTPEEAARLLGPLEAGADRFPDAEQARLLLGLADAYRRAGAFAEAEWLCQAAREKSPDDLGVPLRLFDAAYEAGDADALRRLVDEVRQAEGEDGALWRYAEAARRALLARDADQDERRRDVEAALSPLAEAGQRRPTWPRVPLLAGRVEELAGDIDAAVEKYRQAIDLGDRRPETVRRAVRLLVSRRRVGEAQQVLQKLGDVAPPGGGDLGRLAVEVSLLNADDKDRARELEKAADQVKDSKDPRDHLWLGQLYWSAGKTAEAEAAFRDALPAPEAWTALVLLLADAGKKDQARAELDKARDALPAEQAAEVLAAGLEALGERDRAEAQYQRLLKARPDDPAATQVVAAFYLRGGDWAKAEPLLRRLIDAPGRGGDGAARWARRSLALAKAAGGDYRQTQEALDLLEGNLRERTDPEDQRAKALVLAVRPGGRRESIRLLEDSFARLPPTPDEEFLLAWLYEADGDWAHAEEHYLSLAAGKNPNPAFLAAYAQSLLRHKDAPRAAALLARPEQTDAKGARTVVLKARVLRAEGRGDEAAKLLTEFAGKEFADKKDPAVLGVTAAQLDALGRSKEAEALYLRYTAEAEPKQPQAALALASFLARHDRVSEALAVIDRLGPRWDAETAAAAVASVRSGKATPQDLDHVGRRLADAVAADPRSVYLRVAEADLEDARGRHAEAIRQYREVLRQDPDNVLAMNNLAWLLALHEGKPDEALRWATKAVEAAGPRDNLLDTRGVILVKLGRADEAVRDLEEAAAQTPSAARYYHLGQAQAAAKRPNDAELAWRKAEELGLRTADLHALERSDYERWKAGRGG
jgi:tetratricopeptide (TPR) repeat protein